MTILEAAEEVTHSLKTLFLPDGSGRCAISAQYERFGSDPQFRDNLSF